jgi:hypothetical protein
MIRNAYLSVSKTGGCEFESRLSCQRLTLTLISLKN